MEIEKQALIEFLELENIRLKKRGYIPTLDILIEELKEIEAYDDNSVMANADRNAQENFEAHK